MKVYIDEGHKQYATDKQWKYALAYMEHGSWAAVARIFGVDEGVIRKSVKRLSQRAARQGYSPSHDMTSPVPDGFHYRGQSVLRDGDGKIKLVWEKSNIDHDRQLEIMREAVAAFSEEITPRTPSLTIPAETNANLVNCHIVTDYHLGMMAWGKESGDDWDIDIAEDMFYRWFERALASAPNAKTGILANLGDWCHWDGYDAVTPNSGHVLDADTRYQKLTRVAIRCINRAIEMMLHKYENLHILMCDANHDPAGESWLREMLAFYMSRDPRVTVDTNADTYYCYEHGLTSLFFHHGHKRKVANVDDVFVAKYRDVFGRTKYSYAHLGHLHSKEVKETNLMIVEQHRTMAARDAYAAKGGWVSGRDASVITYHDKHGEVSRICINPDMLS